MINIDGIADHLNSYRIRFGTEAIMQYEVGQALIRALGEPIVERERVLGPKDRVDFYLPEIGLGVECKVDGGPTPVLQQLLRYAAAPEIEGLILVTRRRSHCFAEQTLGGKPLRVVYVGGSQL